jgi:myo-inositol 2-dehydrogenase/D-chiro-inositol 1-dehydrogenase
MKEKTDATRREFLKTTGSTMLGGALGMHVLAKNSPFAFNSDTLKVGLIGCGGRGSGAASQAIKADPNVALTAMADIFPDRLEASYQALLDMHPDKVSVPEAHKFVGFDAYARLLATDVDVVILATPPSFRPAHLEAAVAAGKHIFCEKPVAVDAPGVRRVLEVVKKAKEKNLSLMSGFCWRFDYPKRATFGKVLDGAVGEVFSIYNTYNTGALWSKKREADWNAMTFKLRNWPYYTWLSGDHIVEQAVHSIDLMSWAMGDALPVRASGTGGRQSRIDPERFGNVFDHFAIVYEYENGAKGYHFSRQQEGCSKSYGIEIQGTKGRCEIKEVWGKHLIVGQTNWEYTDKRNDMYQTEHDELFAAIRKGEPFNDGEQMAISTMLAIWGRMVAYTGQTLTWEEALNSQEVLGPRIDQYSWELDWPTAEVPRPGITRFA